MPNQPPKFFRYIDRFRREPPNPQDPAAEEEGSEFEEEANGRLSKVGKFIEVQAADREVWRLIDEPTIFGTNSKVLNDVKIDSRAVDERTTCLALRAGHNVFCRGIKHQGSTPARA